MFSALTDEQFEALAEVFTTKALMFLPHKQGHWWSGWKLGRPIVNRETIHDLVITTMMDTAMTLDGGIPYEKWFDPNPLVIRVPAEALASIKSHPA